MWNNVFNALLVLSHDMAHSIINSSTCYTSTTSDFPFPNSIQSFLLSVHQWAWEFILVILFRFSTEHHWIAFWFSTDKFRHIFFQFQKNFHKIIMGQGYYYHGHDWPLSWQPKTQTNKQTNNRKSWGRGGGGGNCPPWRCAWY